MGADKHIPADIFEEMAGLKEIEVPVSKTSENNIKKEVIITPIDNTRLRAASNSFFSKVQKDFNKNFLRVSKQIAKIQTNSSIKKKDGWSILAKIFIKESKEETTARETTKRWNPFKIIWNTIKFIIKKALNVLRKKVLANISKMFAKLNKPLINLFKNIIRKAKNTCTKASKAFKRTAGKISKFIFKQVKKIVKVFWNIIKKLFLRGKPMAKMFKGEPESLSMDTPSIKKKDNKLKLKFKSIGKRSVFIFKAVKKIFKTLKKLFWKIITKVLDKIIKKITKVIVKMIVKFGASQLIGLLLPGIGNAIMAGVSLTLIGHDILGLIGFIKEVAGTVANINKEFSPEPEEPEEPDDEDNDIDDMSLYEVLQYLKKMEKSGEQNTEEYFEAKRHYLELLADEYKNNGDETASEIVLVALETGIISATPDKVEAKGSQDAIKKVDLNKLQDVLRAYQMKDSQKKWEYKRKNIFHNSEIKQLLEGECDNGPAWAAIWRDIIVYVRRNIPVREELSQYERICKEIMGYPFEKKSVHYFVDAKWYPETQEQRNNRVKTNTLKLLNDSYDYRLVRDEEFGEQDKFEVVIDKAKHYKFDVNSDSMEYRNAKASENELQKMKYFKWQDIYVALKNSDRNNWSKKKLEDLLKSDELSLYEEWVIENALYGF